MSSPPGISSAGPSRSVRELVRHRHGYLCAGKTDRLDAGAFTAAGLTPLSLARAGRRLSVFVAQRRGCPACFGCDEMAHQRSVLLLTCSIQTPFSVRL